jgi:hypothetical protein
MTTFLTHIDIPELPRKITYQTPVLSMGSCFADNIGQALQQRYFPVTKNPFGIVYNPLSIAQSLQRLDSGDLFTAEEIIYTHDLYTSFFHHGSFSHPDKTIFLKTANDLLQKGADTFRESKIVMLSLGTAWAYRHKASGQVVANCHKIPASEFERFMLSVDEIVNILFPIIRSSDKEWIMTVSPIRHWKDGAHGNQLSKATLLMAIEKLQQETEKIYYFPAYEIMMDELRDYRFYADDMLHPSSQAVNYIWERFSEIAFDDNTKQILKEVEKIVVARNHRPFYPETEAYRRFKENLDKQITKINERYPYIKL